MPDTVTTGDELVGLETNGGVGILRQVGLIS